MEEERNEDESDRKNIEVDGGDLGETVYEEANSSVVNVPYVYEEGWNQYGLNQENIEGTGEGGLGRTEAYGEVNSIFENHSHGDEEEGNDDDLSREIAKKLRKGI